jgi:hypothetical protein
MDIIPDRLLYLLLRRNLSHSTVFELDLDFETRTSSLFPKDILNSIPLTLFFLSSNDGKDLLLCFVVQHEKQGQQDQHPTTYLVTHGMCFHYECDVGIIVDL